MAIVEMVGATRLADPEPWAIKGAVGGLTVLWAPYSSYKTFAAVSMAVAVASGQPWFGKSVRKGPVLYILGEGGVELFKRRAASAAAELGLTSSQFKALPLWMTTSAVDLSAPARLEANWAAWDAIAPVLVVVDTVSRALTGDENKQETMQAFVASLDILRGRYGASVVAVHHANRAGQIRGSNVLPSAADVMLRVWKGSQEKGARRTLHFKADKLKDLDTDEFEPKFVYPTVVQVRHEDGSLMVDEFGDEVTTLVLREESEVREREKTALEILKLLAKGRPAGQAVGYKEWLEASGQSKSTFRRAVGGLIARGQISQPVRGQYFDGKVEELFIDFGENYDTVAGEADKGLAESPAEELVEIDEVE